MYRQYDIWLCPKLGDMDLISWPFLRGSWFLFFRQTNSATKIKGDVSKGSWDMKQQNVQIYLSIKYLKLETKKET
jgi:hypothetical protein